MIERQAIPLQDSVPELSAILGLPRLLRVNIFFKAVSRAMSYSTLDNIERSWFKILDINNSIYSSNRENEMVK